MCKAWPEANIIICSPFKRVVQRTYQELLEVLGPNEVGLIGAGGHTRARVTVATAQSLGHCDLDKVRLFIFDEVHKAAAPKTSALLSEIRLARMIGFSASPKGRSDGADLETEALFGPVIFDASYKEAQDAGSIVPVDVYVVRCAGLEGVEERTTSALNRHGIWRHKGRNRKVAAAVAWARAQFGQDIQILVSVSTVDHCVHLGALLPDFAVCYGNMDTDERDKFARWGLIDPKIHPLTAKERERLEGDFEKGSLKRCVATATSGGVWSTGVDFPHLRVLIRADGQGSSILNTQIPGRVSRVSEGKERGVVIDFDDSHHDTLGRRAERRFSSYRGKGWTIHQLQLP
jgi:superfamily II DNA or RNA helicase